MASSHPAPPPHAGMDPATMRLMQIISVLGSPAHAGMDPSYPCLRRADLLLEAPPPTRGWTPPRRGHAKLAELLAAPPPTRGWTVKAEADPTYAWPSWLPRPRGDGPTAS